MISFLLTNIDWRSRAWSLAEQFEHLELIWLFFFFAGHFVEKGTCIILNNYELNKSCEYWENPTEFLPERFIKEGKVVKPAHFIPFGTGKRTCIGQQLVSGFSFILLAGIVQHFDIELTTTKNLCGKAACVALPPDTFPIMLKTKNKTRSSNEWRGMAAMKKVSRSGDHYKRHLFHSSCSRV